MQVLSCILSARSPREYDAGWSSLAARKARFLWAAREENSRVNPVKVGEASKVVIPSQVPSSKEGKGVET